MIEYESRFAVTTDDSLDRISRVADLGEPYVLTDLTMGPNGKASIDRVGWSLRCRAVGSAITHIEFKGKIAGRVTSWEEHSVAVGPNSDPFGLLIAIGMQPGFLLQRIRTVGRLSAIPSVLLSLDECRWLGTFVEIEVVDLPEDSAIELLQEAQVKLGLAGATPAPPYGDQMRVLLECDDAVRREHDIAVEGFLRTASVPTWG